MNTGSWLLHASSLQLPALRDSRDEGPESRREATAVGVGRVCGWAESRPRLKVFLIRPTILPEAADQDPGVPPPKGQLGA